eukprot:2919742-Rhodomonas_salina.1
MHLRQSREREIETETKTKNRQRDRDRDRETESKREISRAIEKAWQHSSIAVSTDGLQAQGPSALSCTMVQQKITRIRSPIWNDTTLPRTILIRVGHLSERCRSPALQSATILSLRWPGAGWQSSRLRLCRLHLHAAASTAVPPSAPTPLLPTSSSRRLCDATECQQFCCTWWQACCRE